MRSSGGYPGSMIGVSDAQIRNAVFAWLSNQRETFGESLQRSDLEDFSLDGRPVPLVGPQGIWKPAACGLPLSITTTAKSPYADSFDHGSETLRYSYRGIDPAHRDNIGLRRAMSERVPLVYFLGVVPGLYVAAYPVFVIRDDPEALTFTLQVDDMSAALAAAASTYPIIDDGAEARRGYVTRTVRQRLHQVAFRERVIRAYAERCALCSLRHQELLDAAHITPDRDPDGEPIVSNGVSLCKLHHAAFDRMFFAIRPDYTIEVKPSILLEHDGPMLVVGLQQIHEKQILLPRRRADLPDPARLERRYSEFLAAV
jgi:putative restriction endonuclease